MYYYQVVFNRPLSWGNTEREALTYASDSEIATGTRVLAELGHSLLNGVVVGVFDDIPRLESMQSQGIKIKHIQKVIDENPIIYEDQLMLAKWMASYYLSSWGECVFTLLPSAKQERATDFSENIISHFESIAPTLTEEQEHCVDNVIEGCNNKDIDMCYVYGITGSGKTEVFLSCIRHILHQQKQVIFLVPEIALVLQCYPLFCARYGSDKVAVLHSGITKSQRYTEWNRIQSGEAKVILGVRSAVFAPVQNLGLIVMDEEHDQSYKSGTTPRYHARQIAMKRCKQHHATLLMGSATPSLEAWAYKDNKRMRFMQLTQRVAGGMLPKIQLVSLQHVQGCVSGVLQKEMQRTLKDNKQVLLLINRRGFAHVFLCSQCGEHFSCPNCSVNLVYHNIGSLQDNQGNHNVETQQVLKCHHCGYQCKLPDACQKCGYVSLGLRGWGTQRVEQELQSLFPDAIIGRLDADVAKEKHKSAEILGKFYRKEIQILVGTQILAKGINFPDLRLVGILFADGLMGIPDFRAEERAFALMTQVAGRAGRFSTDGIVLIQSYDTNNRIFQSLQERNESQFFAEELQRRKQYNLAPVQRLLRVVFRGIKEENVILLTEKFVAAVKDTMTRYSITCTILGPTPCAIEKIASNYRYHVLLSAHTQAMLNIICSEALKSGVKKQSSSKKVYIEIDPDPLTVF